MYSSVAVSRSYANIAGVRAEIYAYVGQRNDPINESSRYEDSNLKRLSAAKTLDTTGGVCCEHETAICAIVPYLHLHR